MTELVIVAVADLPSFHNPFKCGLGARFDAAIADARTKAARAAAEEKYPPVQVAARRWVWQVWRPTTESVSRLEQQRVRDIDEYARRLDSGLVFSFGPGRPGPVDFGAAAAQAAASLRVRGEIREHEAAASCLYHRGVNWIRAAEAATRHAEAGGPLPAVQDDDAFGHLADRDLQAALSLVNRPIRWTPGDLEVGDGQHRSCALVLAGAQRVPVRTD